MPSRLDDYGKYSEDKETNHLPQAVVVMVVEEELGVRVELTKVV